MDAETFTTDAGTTIDPAAWRDDVAHLDTLVRDWYLEARDAGADHRTALDAVLAYDTAWTDAYKGGANPQIASVLARETAIKVASPATVDAFALP